MEMGRSVPSSWLEAKQPGQSSAWGGAGGRPPRGAAGPLPAVGTGSAAQGRELRTGLRLRGCGGAANRRALRLPVSRSVRWRRCSAPAFREEGPRFEGCASVLARRAARAWRAFTSCQRSRLGECPDPTWAPGSTVQPQLWLAVPKEPAFC